MTPRSRKVCVGCRAGHFEKTVAFLFGRRRRQYSMEDMPMTSRLRFGVFLAPFHKPGINPTLALQSDLDLVPPTAEPVCRIRQELIAAPCAADWRAVLEGRLRLGQRRYTALPPQEAEHGVAVVERHPGARMHVTAELAIGCLAPERKQEVGEAPVGAVRTRRAVARVLRAPGGIGDMVFGRTVGDRVVDRVILGPAAGFAVAAWEKP